MKNSKMNSQQAIIYNVSIIHANTHIYLHKLPLNVLVIDG